MYRFLLLFTVALLPMQSFSQNLAPQSTEEALFVRRIMQCLQDKELSLVHAQLYQFLETYPESQFRDTFCALLGDLELGQQQYQLALNAYEQITSEEWKERTLFSRLEALYHVKKWQELEKSLQEYKGEKTALLVYYRAASVAHQNPKLALSLLLKLVKSKSIETSPLLQKQNLLTRAYDLLETLPEALQPLYLFKLGEACAQVHLYFESLYFLHKFIQEFPTSEHCAQAHLLCAHCYLEGGKDFDSFVANAEEALRLNADLRGAPQLHFNLYVAYRKLGKSQPNLLVKAGEHLHAYCLLDASEIPALASFLYHHLNEPGLLTLAEKAIILFDKAMQSDNMLSANSRAQILYVTGSVKEAVGDREQAIKAFKQVVEKASEASPSLLVQNAKLKYARLAFSRLPPEERKLTNPEMTQLLSYLKQLELRKVLSEEPLHLEAAIDYACLYAASADKENQDKMLLSLLFEVKKHFNDKEDLWGKDYAMSRQRLPEKERVFQAYMLLIEGHIARLESKETVINGSEYEREQKRAIARQIYEMLLQENFAVSKYLVDQAKSSLLELDQLL